jgi:hypothetical protein
MPRHARRDLLHRVAEGLTRQRTELGIELATSCGKPISQALGEVDRAIVTFSLAADEARRFGGKVVPLDVDPRAVGMSGLVNRFPLGPISAISPFNFRSTCWPQSGSRDRGGKCARGETSAAVPPAGVPVGDPGRLRTPAGAYNVLPSPHPDRRTAGDRPRFQRSPSPEALR